MNPEGGHHSVSLGQSSVSFLVAVLLLTGANLAATGNPPHRLADTIKVVHFLRGLLDSRTRDH